MSMLHRNLAKSSGEMPIPDIIPVGSLVVVTQDGEDYECMLVKGSTGHSAFLTHLKSGNHWANGEMPTTMHYVQGGWEFELVVTKEDLDEYTNADWRLVKEVAITRNDPPILTEEPDEKSEKDSPPTTPAEG